MTRLRSRERYGVVSQQRLRPRSFDSADKRELEITVGMETPGGDQRWSKEACQYWNASRSN